MTPASTDSARDHRLEEILHAYLQAVDAGRPADRDALLREHADLAPELAAFFASQDEVAQLARGMATPAASDLSAAETLAPGVTKTPGPEPFTRVRYFGDYELIEEIARGGMGVVYKARQVSLNRPVALKMILAGQLASNAEIERFKREAEAAANLDHPHIVPIYEVGQHEGQHYFSMKLIEGGSLAEHVSQLRGDTRAAAQLVATVARAVHYAHQRGILHRDLKPTNILLEGAAGQGSLAQPRITDFGLAKRVTDPTGQDGGKALTQSGAIVGTPGYLAPEQARAEKGLSTAVDVYSLGAILYELLTGQAPFHAGTPLDTILQLLERDPVRPREVNAKVNRDLETICLKCLEKQPTGRYASAEALAQDLERWLRGEPIQARASGMGERLRKWARRRPAAAALVAVSCLATLTLFVVVGVFVWQLNEALAEVSERQQQTDEQRRIAAGQAQLAEERERLARRYWYGADLSLGERALEAGDGPRLHAALERQRSQPGFEELHSFEWDYLWQQAHAEMAVLSVHSPAFDNVPAVAYAPDGKMLAVVSITDVQLWDLATGQVRWTFKGMSLSRVLAFSPDGKTLAVGCWNLNFNGKDDPAQVHLVDTATGQKRSSVNPLMGRVQALAFSSDSKTLAVAQEDYRKIAAPPNTLNALAALSGINTSASSVRFWDLESAEETSVSLKIKGWIVGTGSNQAVFAPDSKSLALGGVGVQADMSAVLRPAEKGSAGRPDPEGIVCYWDASGGVATVLRAPVGNPSVSVAALAFAPSGQALAVGYFDGSIAIRDLPAGKVLQTLAGHHRGVTGLAFAPDGKTLASGGKDGDLRLWDVATGKLVATLLGHQSAVSCIAFAPDGKTFASGSFDHTVRLWETAARPGPILLASSDLGQVAYGASSFALSSEGTTIALAQNNRIELWDAASKTMRETLGPPQAGGPVGVRLGSNRYKFGTELVASRDGAHLAVRSNSGIRTEIEVWDVSANRLQATIRLPREPLRSPLCFMADRPILVSHHKLWDTATGKESTEAFPAELADVQAFSPDKKTFVTAGKFGNSAMPLTVRDIETGAERYTLQTHSPCLAFSSDGKNMVAEVARGEVGVWEVATGRQQTVLRGHAYDVRAAAFSPDGRALATASDDSTVKLWDPVTGQERLTLRYEDRMPGSVAFTADGRTLVVSWGGPLANSLAAKVIALYQVRVTDSK